MRKRNTGFTLVELLIVIVVIAILAAISVVAYRGVASNAQAAAIKANLAQASTKLELYRVDNNGNYPPDQTTLLTLLKSDPTTTLTYGANNTTNPATYCLTATQGTQQFSISSTTNTPSDSACVVNLARDPAATANLNVPGTLGWLPQWFGSGGAGTTTLVTGAIDGPAGLSTYIRKTWTTAPAVSGSGATGFGYCNYSRSGTDTTSGMPVSAGAVYTISSYLRSSKSFTGDWHNEMAWRDSTGAVVGTFFVGPITATLLANTWTRISTTMTAPAGAVRITGVVTPSMSPTSAWAVGDTLDGTGLMVTQGSTLYNYADGSSPGWAWTGTPNASSSIGPAL